MANFLNKKKIAIKKFVKNKKKRLAIFNNKLMQKTQRIRKIHIIFKKKCQLMNV